MRLLEDVQDVCSVKVRSYDVPKLWNVRPGRNELWVSLVSLGTGVFERIVVQPGDHTPATARNALLAALFAARPFEQWSVTVTDEGYFVVTAAQPFIVRGSDGSSGYCKSSAGKVFGFSAGESQPGTTVKAAHRHQLARIEPVYIHVEDYDAVQGAGRGVHNCMEVVTPTTDECMSKKAHDRSAEKRFHPPLARICKLRIRILDWYGDVVDFDNRDNRVDLEFVVRDSVMRNGDGYAPH